MSATGFYTKGGKKRPITARQGDFPRGRPRRTLPILPNQNYNSSKPETANPHKGHGLPGIKKWTVYGGELHTNIRADSHPTYKYETDLGAYSIRPIGNESGRMRGYQVMKEWSKEDPDQRILNGYQLVHSPNEGLKVAREDYEGRLELVRKRVDAHRAEPGDYKLLNPDSGNRKDSP